MTKKNETFAMKTDYWEFKIKEADHSIVEFEITFKDLVIPVGELRKLEDAIRKVLEACGRLEASLHPSKR